MTDFVFSEGSFYKWLVDAMTGNLKVISKTITASGTTGDQEINDSAGSVNLAASATSLVVTNSMVDENTIVHAFPQTNDANCKSCKAIPGDGFFTIVPDFAPDAETRVAFMVVA